MQVGVRVGAVQKADDKAVYLYGYGTYEGDEVPPKGTIGSFGIDVGELGIANPKIVLDSGEVVWGTQCWWTNEQRIKDMIGDREVIMVSVHKVT